MKEIRCLRCNELMQFYKRDEIQLGTAGFIMGNIDNIVSGSVDTEMYACPICGKLEFFLAKTEELIETENYEGEDEILQVVCPECGASHDMDYPKCPECGYKYISE